MPEFGVIHSIFDMSPAAAGLSSSVNQLAASFASNHENVLLHLLTCSAKEHITSDLTDTENLRLSSIDSFRFWRKKTDINYISDLSSITPKAIIHDHGMWLPLNHNIADISAILGLPRVVSTHGMLSPYAFQHKYFKKLAAWNIYQRRDLARATVVHTTSMQEGKNVKALLPNVHVAIIPWGSAIPDLSQIRISSLNNTGIKSIVFLGRYHPIKGLALLLESWAAVRDESWKLILVGHDENGYRKQLEHKAKDLGLFETVEFRGPVHALEKQELLQSASLLVLPSLTENFGLVVAEALAYEVPVITTNATPWSDLVDYSCGWIAEANNVHSLTKAIRCAVQQPDWRLREMGKNGRQLVLSKYSWEVTADKMMSLYRWALKLESHKPSFVI